MALVIGIGLVGLGIYLLTGRQIMLNIPKLQKGGSDGTLLSMFLFGVSYAVASLSCTIGPFLAVTSTTFRNEKPASRFGGGTVRRIEVNGKLRPGVYAKDVILHIIRTLGVKGGIGYAYEYAGEVFDAITMEERMTVCNMAIEGGARCGYVNPDEKTVEYLRGRPYVDMDDFEATAAKWLSFASDADAAYDDVVRIDAADIEPTVTWGISPDHGIAVSESIPDPATAESPGQKATIEEALAYMKLPAGTPIKGVRIDVAFLGSCTNGRLSDFREVARFLKGRQVAPGVKAIAVPGSQIVAHQCAQEGIDKVFEEAGFEWRGAGCSMCLAMNPDKLVGDQICASSSNRNFKGRQGSPTGRTILMSPVMVAAAAVSGAVADAREVFEIPGATAAA